jgi:hypothetical protein
MFSTSVLIIICLMEISAPFYSTDKLTVLPSIYQSMYHINILVKEPLRLQLTSQLKFSMLIMSVTCSGPLWGIRQCTLPSKSTVVSFLDDGILKCNITQSPWSETTAPCPTQLTSDSRLAACSHPYICQGTEQIHMSESVTNEYR